MARQLVIAVLVALISAVHSLAGAQFSSGSDGSDGALIFPASPTTVNFDPKSFDPPLDPDGDGVYHFTEINIPAGVTVRVLADKVGWQPLYWLSTGDVLIDGVLNLDGEDGSHESSGGPGTPGPGGFYGGAPTRSSAIGSYGFGPGNNTRGGSHPGNRFLSPLTGGSGGRGSTTSGGDAWGYWGGAGGGAILLSSDTSITVNGSLLAKGGGAAGSGSCLLLGLPGAGGAIHLVSPVIAGGGTGEINVSQGALSGCSSNDYADHGWLLFESNNRTYSGSIFGSGLQITYATLPPVPPTIHAYTRPRIRLVSIDGNPVSEVPSSSFVIPEVSLNKAEAVPFVVYAENVPVGSRPTVYLLSELAGAQGFQFPEPGLFGDLSSSTQTHDIAIPRGFTQGWVWVDW